MKTGCQFGVRFFPSGLLFLFLAGISAFCFQNLGIVFLDVGEYRERMPGIATEVFNGLFDGSACCAQRLPVGGHFVRVVFVIGTDSAFPHQRVADNQDGTFFLILCGA